MVVWLSSITGILHKRKLASLQEVGDIRAVWCGDHCTPPSLYTFTHPFSVHLGPSGRGDTWTPFLAIFSPDGQKWTARSGEDSEGVIIGWRVPLPFLSPHQPYHDSSPLRAAHLGPSGVVRLSDPSQVLLLLGAAGGCLLRYLLWAWFCAYRCLLLVNWRFAFISLVAGMSLVSSRELLPFPYISHLLHSSLVRPKLPNPGGPTDHPIIRRERHRFHVSWKVLKVCQRDFSWVLVFRRLECV